MFFGKFPPKKLESLGFGTFRVIVTAMYVKQLQSFSDDLFRVRETGGRFSQRGYSLQEPFASHRKIRWNPTKIGQSFRVSFFIAGFRPLVAFRRFCVLKLSIHQGGKSEGR
jgi:hypothetical protein